MKNLFKIIIIAIITSVAVSSCKQMSVVKRKYNKGYYVSHTNKLPDVKSESSSVSTKGQPSNVSTKGEKPEYLKPVPITSLGASASKTTEKEYAPTASATAPQKADRTYNPANEPKNFMGTNLSFKEINLLPAKLFSKGAVKGLAGQHEHDGLSLLWIIIVILLILWLLGFLFDGFGLGYAIHVLVLIAVILLILWLLRII